MRKVFFSFMFAALGASALPVEAAVDAARLLAGAPLRFEPAAKTRDGESWYLARGLRFGAAVSAHGFALRLDADSLRVGFEGADAAATLAPGQALTSKTSLLIGNNRAGWRQHISNYGDLSAESIYRGIGLRYYSAGGQLEYDLTVDPGADLSQIRLRFTGSEPQLDSNGNLRSAFIQKRPEAYQVIAGKRVAVASRYVRNSDGTFGFRVAAYDRTRPLVLDPLLTFGAYVGGTGQDIAYGVGIDSQGFVYVAGTTAATDLTAVGDANKSTNSGSFDLFVAKLDPTPGAANPVLYVTYIGGSGADNLKAMSVAPSGMVYLAGVTSSTDYPLAGNSVQSTISGTTDAFISALDTSQPSGSALIYSSYFGGTKDDTAYAIGATADGRRMYVAGDTNSSDMPTTNPFQSGLNGSEDMFVLVLDIYQTTPVYASYLGGSSTEYARGLVVQNDGTLWLTGGTYSGDFPLAGSPISSNYQQNCDVFLAQIDPAQGGSSLLYSTYYGGTGQDVAEAMSVDPTGKLVITGITSSSNFPTTGGAIKSTYGGATDAFVAVFDPATPSRMAYATYYGGNSFDFPTAIQADASGIIHMTGYTASSNLPVSSGAIAKASGGYSGFYLKLNPSVSGSSGMDFSSYVGGPGTQVAYGVAVDANSNVFLAGFASSGIFDALGGPGKSTAAGDSDAFVIGLSPCNYSLSTQSNQFGAAGGSFTLSVGAARDCRWTVSNSLDWIKVTGAPANGSANITLTAAPNGTGSARTGTISVAGQQFVVNQ